ncbi:MAG: triose-phosphate isomerase [Lachnospiraceae bacterium]|jgi:triosephosphate isomerase|nr:triose-phosphate isomerase [Lachnospiraceae bacterium]
MRQIKAPFLIVNPKSYLYGEKSLQLALAADRAAGQYGIDVFFTCPYSDLRLIKEHTKHLILTAQHMDSLVPGRGMGYVLPEALRDAGVEAVFLNHAEHPLTVNELYKTMKRAKETGIATIVCADSVAEGIALSRLHPTIILCEPTDLIGVGKIADDSYITDATEKIRRESPDVLVVIASSITTADDVRKVIRMGADGTGATSGIIKAPDPAQRVMEMAAAAAEFKKGESEK